MGSQALTSGFAKNPLRVLNATTTFATSQPHSPGPFESLLDLNQFPIQHGAERWHEKHPTDRPENRFVNPDPGGTVALTAPHSMTLSASSDDWRDQSACRDTDPDLFFPVGTTGPAIEQIENAKSVCTDCDVRQPCLDFALATNQDSGIWGGTSEEERRKLRRQWLAARRKAS